jgi:hypothetical protein
MSQIINSIWNLFLFIVVVALIYKLKETIETIDSIDMKLSSFIKFFDDDYTKKLYNSIESLIEHKGKKI